MPHTYRDFLLNSADDAAPWGQREVDLFHSIIDKVLDHGHWFEPVLIAGSVDQYYRGDKTWQHLDTTAVPEGQNLYFTTNRVKVITDPLYAPINHVGAAGGAHGLASANSAGFMGASDFTKLAGLSNYVLTKAAIEKELKGFISSHYHTIPEHTHVWPDITDAPDMSSYALKAGYNQFTGGNTFTQPLVVGDPVSRNQAVTLGVGYDTWSVKGHSHTWDSILEHPDLSGYATITWVNSRLTSKADLSGATFTGAVMFNSDVYSGAKLLLRNEGLATTWDIKQSGLNITLERFGSNSSGQFYMPHLSDGLTSKYLAIDSTGAVRSVAMPSFPHDVMRHLYSDFVQVGVGSSYAMVCPASGNPATNWGHTASMYGNGILTYRMMFSYNFNTQQTWSTLLVHWKDWYDQIVKPYASVDVVIPPGIGSIVVTLSLHGSSSDAGGNYSRLTGHGEVTCYSGGKIVAGNFFASQLDFNPALHNDGYFNFEVYAKISNPAAGNNCTKNFISLEQSTNLTGS